MKKIFLSASIPTLGREYYEGSNPLLIREAVAAFCRVCMEYHIEFYFGGHPAISPLVYQIARNYLGDETVPIHIYQSEYFRGDTPDEIKYFKNIRWTPRRESLTDSVSLMRSIMFKENKDTICAVFIGGMKGIINEAESIKKMYPGVDMLPVASAGCASAKVYELLGLEDPNLSSNYAYLTAFRKLLLKYKE